MTYQSGSLFQSDQPVVNFFWLRTSQSHFWQTPVYTSPNFSFSLIASQHFEIKDDYFMPGSPTVEENS